MPATFINSSERIAANTKAAGNPVMAEEPDMIFVDWPIAVIYGAVDPILALINREIDRFRIQSFKRFALDITVMPSSEASEYYDTRTSTFVGYDRYNYNIYSKETKSMQTRLDDDSNIQIWRKKKWRSLDTYLKTLKPAIDYNTRPTHVTRVEHRVRRNQQQQRWWAANGKTFDLSELPSEIRGIIYGYAVGSEVIPYPTAKARKLAYAAEGALIAKNPNTALLFTSKAIYMEASSILFNHTTFLIDIRGVLSELLRIEEQYSEIRRLRLALSHFDYFKLFGMSSTTGIIYQPKPAAYILSRMKLECLEIDFAAPSSYSAVSWLEDACQKSVVDWILDEAWYYIRMHPIKISGYVKDASRALLQVRINKEKTGISTWQQQRIAVGEAEGDIQEYYDTLDEEEGGVAVLPEKTVEKATVCAKLKTLPLTCTCRCKCQQSTWRPAD